MIKVDLITGFLGSGKTTFLKKYAGYLIEQGLRIGILENDFGAVNVDMMMLQDIEGDNCALEMVAGGCDADCHHRRFKTKLIAMGMSGYDRVIIEPSGIFDMDEFFDVLREDPLERWYEIGNVIAIVDAGLQRELTKESSYILASQVANAGCVLLSKTKMVESHVILETKQAVEGILQSVCTNDVLPKQWIQKDWDCLTKEDYDKIMCCGYQTASYVKEYHDRDVFSSLYYMNLDITKETLLQVVSHLFGNKVYGNIFRIKGFLCDEKGQWFQLNATAQSCDLQPVRAGQNVIIVIGENLCKEEIDRRFEAL